MAASLRVGVDLDGVVADFTSGWVRRYNAQFGAALSADDAIEWNAGARMTHFGSTGGFWRWARRAGPHGRSVFRDLPLYPGALDGLRRLQSMAHVAVLTTKPHWAVADTLHWLATLDLPLREVHVTDDKAAVDCAVYIDDANPHLRSIRARRPDAVVCRWVRPWNSPHDGCVDVQDWADVHVVVRELSQRRSA